MADCDWVVLQLIDAQSSLEGYIYSLVLDRELTKDLLQQTNVVVLEKQSSFQQGTNFFAWACRIAYHEVLAMRRDRSRERYLFDDNLLAALAVKSAEVFEHHSERMEALLECLSELQDEQRELILARSSFKTSSGLP